MAGKAQKGMESTYKMTQDAQNQPLLRDKQALENELERQLFPTKLTEATAQIEQIKADTNYRNAMAQYQLGRVQAETAMVTGRGSLGTFQSFLSLYDGAGTASGGTAGAGAGQVTNGVDWGFKTGVSR